MFSPSSFVSSKAFCAAVLAWVIFPFTSNLKTGAGFIWAKSAMLSCSFSICRYWLWPVSTMCHLVFSWPQVRQGGTTSPLLTKIFVLLHDLHCNTASIELTSFTLKVSLVFALL